MKRTLTLLAAAGLVLGLMAGPVQAKPNDRPFAARATGTTFTDAAACTVGNGVAVCPQETSTQVIARHLGHSRVTATGTATLDFTAPTCTNPAGESGTPLLAEQDMVIVAANGSELHAHTVATGCFVDFGHPSDVTGTYTITGGTGRFADATGHGEINAYVADLALTSTWAGTITY